MIKVFETTFGRVAFKDWNTYAGEGVTAGSMGSVAKETGAVMVLLVGEAVDLASMTQEQAEELAAYAHKAVPRNPPTLN